MQNVVIDKPYTPVPPYRGRVWPWVLARYVTRILRKKYGVVRVECVHADRLARSIAAGHGVLLTPNHCRDEDPMVLGALTREVHSPFFLLASWHIFMQSRMQSYLLRRAGAFSIYREGIDRGAVNTAVEMLVKAERPLVLFPEGFVSRTNDQLNVLMDGTALIARTAAKRRAEMTVNGKRGGSGKVVVHPIALRYRFQGSVEEAVAPVLSEIEQRLTWHKQDGKPVIERIHHVGGALLALKEIEYLGGAGGGVIGPRLVALTDAILGPLELEWLGKKKDDDVPARVKRLRTAILPDMTKGQLDEAERQRRWKQLADVYLAQQLFHYPPEYLASNPTPERLLETVERMEEDLTDKVRPHGAMHATVTVGEAIEASTTREGRGAAGGGGGGGGGDPMMEQIESQLRGMLGLDGAA